VAVGTTGSLAVVQQQITSQLAVSSGLPGRTARPPASKEAANSREAASVRPQAHNLTSFYLQVQIINGLNTAEMF